MSKYYELLKSPEWKKRRLEILESDGWKCKRCGIDEDLQVHHLHYRKGLLPWKYKDDELMTVCKGCHESIHSFEDELDKLSKSGTSEIVRGKVIDEFIYSNQQSKRNYQVKCCVHIPTLSSSKI